jgi:hypothetical protein
MGMASPLNCDRPSNACARSEPSRRNKRNPLPELDDGTYTGSESVASSRVVLWLSGVASIEPI